MIDLSNQLEAEFRIYLDLVAIVSTSQKQFELSYPITETIDFKMIVQNKIEKVGTAFGFDVQLQYYFQFDSLRLNLVDYIKWVNTNTPLYLHQQMLFFPLFIKDFFLKSIIEKIWKKNGIQTVIIEPLLNTFDSYVSSFSVQKKIEQSAFLPIIDINYLRNLDDPESFRDFANPITADQKGKNIRNPYQVYLIVQRYIGSNKIEKPFLIIISNHNKNYLETRTFLEYFIEKNDIKSFHFVEPDLYIYLENETFFKITEHSSDISAYENGIFEDKLVYKKKLIEGKFEMKIERIIPTTSFYFREFPYLILFKIIKDREILLLQRIDRLRFTKIDIGIIKLFLGQIYHGEKNNPYGLMKTNPRISKLVQKENDYLQFTFRILDHIQRNQLKSTLKDLWNANYCDENLSQSLLFFFKTPPKNSDIEFEYTHYYQDDYLIIEGKMIFKKIGYSLVVSILYQQFNCQIKVLYSSIFQEGRKSFFLFINEVSTVWAKLETIAQQFLFTEMIDTGQMTQIGNTFVLMIDYATVTSDKGKILYLEKNKPLGDYYTIKYNSYPHTYEEELREWIVKSLSLGYDENKVVQYLAVSLNNPRTDNVYNFRCTINQDTIFPHEIKHNEYFLENVKTISVTKPILSFEMGKKDEFNETEATFVVVLNIFNKGKYVIEVYKDKIPAYLYNIGIVTKLWQSFDKEKLKILDDKNKTVILQTQTNYDGVTFIESIIEKKDVIEEELNSVAIITQKSKDKRIESHLFEINKTSDYSILGRNEGRTKKLVLINDEVLLLQYEDLNGKQETKLGIGNTILLEYTIIGFIKNATQSTKIELKDYESGISESLVVKLRG